MEATGKTCARCLRFRRYYTMAYCTLEKETNGYCSLRKEVKENGDSCDKWHCRYLSKEKRKNAAIRCIPELYKKLAIIEQILQEAKEEDNPPFYGEKGEGLI